MKKKRNKTNFGECSHLSATQKKRALETLGKERLVDRMLTKFHQSSNIYIKNRNEKIHGMFFYVYNSPKIINNTIKLI